MSSFLYTYDVDLLGIQYGGVQFTGFPKGDRISIEAEEMDWSHSVGSDGSVIRTAKNNDVTKVTLRLLQESISNPALYALRQTDVQFGLGALPLIITYGIVPLPVFSATAAYIEKLPNQKYNNDDERVLEWVLICAGCKHLSPVSVSVPTL